MTNQNSYRDKIYKNYLTTTYAPRNDLTEQGIENTVTRYQFEYSHYLPSDKEILILDIGCGKGAFLEFCRRNGYENLIGLDISPEQVTFCQQHGFTDVFCANGLDFLTKTTHKFGLIALIDVLEHLPKDDVLLILEAIYYRLLPGGVLILQVPNMSNPFNIRTRYVDFTHEVGFSKESLQQVLRVAGFEIKSVYGSYLPHRQWIVRFVFSHLLWKAFLLFYRYTMHLTQEIVPGKNLIGIGTRIVTEQGHQN